MASRVSGPVVAIHIKDNQEVQKGDLLFEIDPSLFQVKVDQAKANFKRDRSASRGNKIEYKRMQKISARDRGAVSQKELTRTEINYYKFLSSIDASKESLKAAKLDLKFTKIYASVDGYVSNINFQIGSQAVANQAILALVDVNSFWVFGYFRESEIEHIEVGADAIVTLMAYEDQALHGKVESIAWGISHSDGNPGANLLPSIKPVFQWIRLAQRIPVRIKLDELPKGIELRFGLTASVLVKQSKD
ncbi:HlyD family secretion protein [Sulfurimonas sp. MAG313]|nr:HlyD family secretion protein [Sulfurimonas sp. MAG313]